MQVKSYAYLHFPLILAKAAAQGGALDFGVSEKFEAVVEVVEQARVGIIAHAIGADGLHHR